MGYRIEYPEPSGRQRRPSRLWISACWFLFALLLIGILREDFRYDLQRLLFPGDAAAALAELERLAGNLQSGTPLGQALEAFCAGVVSR